MNTIAQFSIDYREYLNANGELVHPLPEFAHSVDVLIELYRRMWMLRAFDHKAVALQRTGRMGTYPSSLGQEATFVGIGYALEPSDVFVPYYRDQGVLLARGVKPSEIFGYWGGDERNNDYAMGGRDLPICVPIASQLLHAAGVAYAMKLRRQPHAVLTCCGEGGTSEGDFYEAINFAGAFELPVVFVVNNNQWAISVSREKQTGAKTIAQKAIAGGFTGIQVDGNDVIAVSAVVREALQKAREGGGATLIEAVTYRLCDHTTADDAKRYTEASALERAWACEPLKRLHDYLVNHQAWNENREQQLQAEIEQVIAQGVQDYLEKSPAEPTDMMDYLYAELPSAYQAQRAEIVHYSKTT